MLLKFIILQQQLLLLVLDSQTLLGTTANHPYKTCSTCSANSCVHIQLPRSLICSQLQPKSGQHKGLQSLCNPSQHYRKPRPPIPHLKSTKRMDEPAIASASSHLKEKLMSMDECLMKLYTSYLTLLDYISNKRNKNEKEEMDM